MPDHTSDQLHAQNSVKLYGGIRPAARALGIPESTLRGRLKGACSVKPTPTPPPIPDHGFIPTELELPPSHIGEEGIEEVDLSRSNEVQRFIVTSAQNNVEVHQGFLDNLKALARDVNAKIIVSCTLYDRQGYRGLVRKGETRVAKRDIWWDAAIRPYLMNTRAKLHRRLAVCGELDILATAKDPLSGMESYCGRSSILVPHNKFAFRCVESRKHQMPKEMYTTGSVTKPKFIQRKAGQLAHFHHVLGALLVEVTDRGYWHVHHLNAEEDGSFFWLDKRVANGEVRKNTAGIAGIVLGDVHVEKSDPAVTDASLRMLEETAPKTVVLHDLIDFRSRNHHNRKDPIHAIRMVRERTTVREEIDQAAKFVSRVQESLPRKSTVVVARGNHDSAFDRWIKETDWRDDPVNAVVYLRTALAMVASANAGEEGFNAVEYYLRHHTYFSRVPGRNVGSKAIRFLKLDESYEIAGVECGIHGHVGPSGARGNPRQFSKLGFKSFTAHTHTPSIHNGAYTVGVLGNLDMEYNVGPSKWLHCHGLIYPNGKRAFLFLKGGRYRA